MTAKPDNHDRPAFAGPPAAPAATEPPDASAHFPILEEMDFFNHAGVAPLSGPAGEAMAEWARDAARRAYTGGGWYKRCEHLKTLCARMIHARGPHEIALVPNTSTGLAFVARGLPWKRGDHIVTTGVEYPANRYPWQDLERLGVTRTEIPQRPDGRIDADEVCDAVTDDTKLVALSHVQYASGHRVALRDIADTVHRVRGYLCVDAIQSVGAMPVDVQRDGVDFLVRRRAQVDARPRGVRILLLPRGSVRDAAPGHRGMAEHDRRAQLRRVPLRVSQGRPPLRAGLVERPPVPSASRRASNCCSTSDSKTSGNASTP